MITPETMQAAYQWCDSQKPREGCGLVIIEKGHETFVPCRNISEVDHQFILHPADYAAAETRGEIVRVIHSHCYHRPFPSDADKVACESSGLPWSIVSVPGGDWYHMKPNGYKAPLIGRQWAHAVLDCYSLIRDYYKEMLGIHIPDFDRDFEWWMKGQNLYVENFRVAGFEEIDPETPREHDVLLIQVMSPVINHGAIYLGNDKMLHHLHGRLSSRDVYGGYWKKHCVKVVRHSSLC